MLTEIGFTDLSTTLGHALSFVFSNQGVPYDCDCHLVYRPYTQIQLIFLYYQRFKRIAQRLKFEPRKLKLKTAS